MVTFRCNIISETTQTIILKVHSHVAPLYKLVGQGQVTWTCIEASSLPFFTYNSDQRFPKQQILDSSKLKELADDSFELYENGRKFSKRIKNTVGKGEIACYEQFLFFPHCFQKTCSPDT